MRCFKCEKSVVTEGLSIAYEGSIFEGGHTYGSKMCDSLVDGVFIRLVICDECLKNHTDLMWMLKRTNEKHVNDLIVQAK